MSGSCKVGSFILNGELVGVGQGSVGRKAGRGNRYECFCNVSQAVKFSLIHKGDFESLEDF